MGINRIKQPARFMRFQSVLWATSFAVGAFLAAPPVLAQFPAKPIRIVVSVSPGGAPDTVARVLGERLSSLLGQPVVVENRAGSNGIIAIDLVAKSAPDGYTMVMVADSMIVINPHMYAKSPVDVLKDIVPVAPVAEQANFILSVHPSVPVKTFQEFLDHAKSVKPSLAYASAGAGSQHQMAMEMLKARAKIDLVHVPYKGGAPAAAATLAGETAAMFSGASSAPQIRAGRLRALAVTGAKRSPLFPELPTIGEFYPGYQLSTWIALFSPAGVPDPSMARLRSEINKVLAMADVKQRFNAAGGLDPMAGTTPQEFSERIRSDYEKYGSLVKLIGAKVDN
jgi:tripartite-type tricarboxylate transporter receptor subunit TctC